MRVAYLGPAGTHSEEALRASAPPDSEEIPYPTIYDAVMAVQDGTVDTAIVPIENALEGSVGVTMDTLVLDADDVRIAAEVVHPIHHCAIAASELSLSQVQRVISHPQATAQCAHFLRKHLPRAEHTIEMCHRFGFGDVGSGRGSVAVRIHAGQVGDCHRNICHHAIAHGDAFHFARPVTFPGAAKQTADT